MCIQNRWDWLQKYTHPFHCVCATLGDCYSSRDLSSVFMHSRARAAYLFWIIPPIKILIPNGTLDRRQQPIPIGSNADIEDRSGSLVEFSPNMCGAALLTWMCCVTSKPSGRKQDKSCENNRRHHKRMNWTRKGPREQSGRWAGGIIGLRCGRRGGGVEEEDEISGKVERRRERTSSWTAGCWRLRGKRGRREGEEREKRGRREGEGLLPNLVVFPPVMSPIEPGLPHARLSPQTQHATLFSRATRHYVNRLRASLHRQPRSHKGWRSTHTDGQTHTRERTNTHTTCSSSNFPQSQHPLLEHQRHFDSPDREREGIRVCESRERPNQHSSSSHARSRRKDRSIPKGHFIIATATAPPTGGQQRCRRDSCPV